MYYVKYRLDDNKLVGCHYNKNINLDDVNLTDEDGNVVYGVDEITKEKFEQIQGEGLGQVWK